MSDHGCTVHLCPPHYPEQLHPFRCRHEPQFQMMANARTKNGRIALGCPMCMACGAPLPGTHGNVFACIAECQAAFGFDRKIGRQLIYLRDRYLRIAVHLFGKDGWGGRHRKWAELLDPNLTMRVDRRGVHLDGTRFVAVFIDNSYFHEGDAA